MKFSVAWLREWVDPPVDAQELAEQLTMAGLEVDAVEPVAEAFTGVVVGHVETREQHPNADKLSLCSVDVGGQEKLQIICGAANVAAGQKVPVATIGGVLPGNFKIKRAKLRGVESHGMICSASELGLAESSDGIMVLEEDAPLGADFREYMGLEDSTIEVDLTPDRGDCLSIAGIAREVGVLNRTLVDIIKSQPVAPLIDDRFEVALEATEDCPAYYCRIVRGVNPQAPTPLWLKERLRRSGVRPISVIVDITNYVMLELGQPMHAFDLARLDGGIRVRRAEAGETLKLLDGSEVTLREDTLVIADQGRPLALAGVMGGEDSSVTDATRDILFESAFFAPQSIIGKARSYGLHTDSSYRFERGVDPGLQQQALERATELLLEISGGEPGPVVETLGLDNPQTRQLITLREARIGRLLGIQIDAAEVEEILKRLGMELTRNEQGWVVCPPSCRFDIAIEEDLIEEVGRIYGYSRIPATQGAASPAMRSRAETSFRLALAKAVLVDRDYHEAITYSFVAPEVNRRISPDQEDVILANPISADMSVMRSSLWPGLLQAVRYNTARQQSRVRLFEAGLRFTPSQGELLQQPMLAGAITGPVLSEQWGEGARAADFYDIKGDLEAVLGISGDLASFRFVPQQHPALHPGQSAALYRGERLVGWLGMLHPEIEAELEMAAPVYLFEIATGDGLLDGTIPTFEPLSKYPSMRRDIALMLDQDVGMDQVVRCARESGPEFLRDILLFDVYNGEKIEAGRKSLALGLIFQETTGNLSDAQVEEGVAAILRALAQELKAQLRE
jgi:phenylalanyl-tRNA synthetase beta chain